VGGGPILTVGLITRSVSYKTRDTKILRTSNCRGYGAMVLARIACPDVGSATAHKIRRSLSRAAQSVVPSRPLAQHAAWIAASRPASTARLPAPRPSLDPVFRKLWEHCAKDELSRAEAWLRAATRRSLLASLTRWRWPSPPARRRTARRRTARRRSH
jgi:hypothetical protein